MTKNYKFGRAFEVENDSLSFYKGKISTVVVLTKIENGGKRASMDGKKMN